MNLRHCKHQQEYDWTPKVRRVLRIYSFARMHFTFPLVYSYSHEILRVAKISYDGFCMRKDVNRQEFAWTVENSRQHMCFWYSHSRIFDLIHSKLLCDAKPTKSTKFGEIRKIFYVILWCQCSIDPKIFLLIHRKLHPFCDCWICPSYTDSITSNALFIKFLFSSNPLKWKRALCVSMKDSTILMKPHWSIYYVEFCQDQIVVEHEQIYSKWVQKLHNKEIILWLLEIETEKFNIERV